MQTEMWEIGRIEPNPNNPRINDTAVTAVAASIREFG
jgi:ParB-like chromosome segregation protein Spo0J